MGFGRRRRTPAMHPALSSIFFYFGKVKKEEEEKRRPPGFGNVATICLFSTNGNVRFGPPTMTPIPNNPAV